MKLTAKPRKLHRNNWWYKNWPYLMLTLPGIAVLFLMHTVPLYGLIMAFKDYNFADGVWGSPWNGFENFKYFFSVNRNILWCVNADFNLISFDFQ